MATEYTNLGPIYTTAAKYEAAKTAGTLEVGREYKIVDWEAQEKLVAGSNITIAEDGKTISAAASAAYSPFPTEFNTTGTLQEFGQSIINYTKFKAGYAWYGGIECSDLPGDLVQVECKVTALRDTTDYIENLAVIEIYSSEVAPFYWTYNTNSWNKGTGLDDWKYVAQIDESKLNNLSATVNDTFDIKCKYVDAAAGSKGWEFYAEKGVAANPTLAGTESDLTGIEIAGTKYKVPEGGTPSAYLVSANMADNILSINSNSGITTTFAIAPSTAEVSGASTAKSINFNGTNWNLPSSGSSSVWSGVPFKGSSPAIETDGTYELYYIATVEGDVLKYILGTVVQEGSSGQPSRTPLVKKKNINEYFMAQLTPSGKLFIYSVDTAGNETTEDLSPISTETVSTKVFYRKIG